MPHQATKLRTSDATALITVKEAALSEGNVPLVSAQKAFMDEACLHFPGHN